MGSRALAKGFVKPASAGKAQVQGFAGMAEVGAGKATIRCLLRLLQDDLRTGQPDVRQVSAILSSADVVPQACTGSTTAGAAKRLASNPANATTGTTGTTTVARASHNSPANPPNRSFAQPVSGHTNPPVIDPRLRLKKVGEPSSKTRARALN